MPGPSAVPIVLSEDERAELVRRAGGPGRWRSDRARIILACADGEIMSFVEHHNDRPKPFQWTKSADDILKSIERFCAYNSPAKA